MEMSKVQIGRMFEKQAIPILIKEGYRIVDEASKKNWGSVYYFEVEKDGVNYYIEVRSRKTGKYIQYFSFAKQKMNRLRSLDKEVLFLCINTNKYISILKLKDETICVVTSKLLSKRAGNFILCSNNNCRHKWLYYENAAMANDL